MRFPAVALANLLFAGVLFAAQVAGAQSAHAKPIIEKIRGEHFSICIEGMDLAAGSDMAVVALCNLHVRIWHMDDGRIEQELVFPDPETDARQKTEVDVEPIRVHFSSDGGTLGVSYLSQILLYDTHDWHQVVSLGVVGEDKMREPQQPQLSRRTDDKKDELNTPYFTKLRQWIEEGDGRTRITDFSFTPDGSSLIASYCRGGCYDHTLPPRTMAYPSGNDPIRLWDIKSRQLIWQLVPDRQGVVDRIIVSYDGKLFAISDRQPGKCKISLYGTRSGELVWSLPESQFFLAVPAILFIPTKNELVTFQVAEAKSGPQLWKQLAVYRATDGKMIAAFPKDQGMSDAAISPDGIWLASTTWRGSAFQVWDMRLLKRVSTSVPGGLFNASVFDSVQFSHDGQRLVVASRFAGLVDVYRFVVRK